MDHPDKLLIAKGRYGCSKRLAVCLLNAGLAAWAEPVTAESNPCANGIVVSEPQDHPSLVADCEVLLGLRDHLAGDRGLNWSADVPITQWDGIAVGDSGVKTLELGDNELTGVIPPELGHLSQLQWLSLYDNRLTGSIPPELSRLSQLEWLDLSGNVLTGSIPPELSQLIALRGLYLYGNELIGSIPLELSQLTALRGLRLDNNGLTGVIPPELGRLVDLEELNLDGNALTGCAPATLARWIDDLPVCPIADQDFLDGNGDFELEDLRSWTVVSGGAWEVKDFDHPNKRGRFYATTCNEVWPGNGGCKNGSGERDTGVLVSEVFTAPGGFLEFRIAGFNGRSCNSTFNHLSLRRASDDEELRRAEVPCRDPFRLHSWSLENLAGVEVYIRVEDANAQSGWAWIAVDGFRLTGSPADSTASVSYLELSAPIGEITFTSRRDGGEAIYTTDGSEIVRTIDYVDWKLFYPSWSPSGRVLAAVSNRYTSNQEIYLFFYDDGEVDGMRRLTNHSAADHHPAWSPDGQFVAFISDRTGDGDLYMVPVEGGEPVRLTRGAPVSDPTWSPDGGRIAFAQDGDIRSVDLLSGAVSVISDAWEWEGHPSWSPDGDRIAFSADGELVVLDLQQGTRRRITRGYSYVSDPSWSPDQTFIAFASSRKGAPEIYVVEIATERIARITLARDVWGDRDPVWYPGDHAIPTIPSVEVLTPLVRTEVEATVLGAEVEGLTVEFARATAGRQPDYSWSAITDAAGWLELTITSPNRTGVSGYYQARARNADGEVVGQWHSIPLNQGRRQILELTLGGGVRVVAVERLDAAKEVAQQVPLVSSLEPNYPNPFNTSTQIAYRLATPGLIRLEIYNALGQPVRTLVDQVQAAGFHQVHWDARDQRGAEIAAGVYITRLLYPGGVQTRRLLLLK